MQFTKKLLKQLIKEEHAKLFERGFGEGEPADDGFSQKRIIQLEEEEQEEGNVYAICTDSVAKTAGTTERSEWSAAATKRYERCIKKLSKKSGYHK